LGQNDKLLHENWKVPCQSGHGCVRYQLFNDNRFKTNLLITAFQCLFLASPHPCLLKS